MQRKLHAVSSLVAVLACAFLAFTASTQVQAQDKKADPTGTWTWSRPGRDGGPARVTTLKLKVDGDKVTGTVSGREGTEPTKIENGKIKDDEISFAVTREFNGNSMTMKYNGKINGDAIKGKMETERDGQTRSSPWEAKRVTEKSTEKK
jgi:hypothetical protein